MSAQGEQLTDFERRSRLVLEESVLRIDGRVRSRLNQARQAAVEAASAKSRPMFWRFFTLVPTAGAVAAALLVAMVLWHRAPDGEPPIVAAVTDTHAGDLDLLADGEGLDLVQDGDGSGSFYEWAADQSEAGGNETDT
jgi:anti-sigma-K factor RskA